MRRVGSPPKSVNDEVLEVRPMQAGRHLSLTFNGEISASNRPQVGCRYSYRHHATPTVSRTLAVIIKGRCRWHRTISARSLTLVEAF